MVVKRKATKKGKGVSSHKLASGVSSHQLASGVSSHQLASGIMPAPHSLGGAEIADHMLASGMNKSKMKKLSSDLMKGAGVISDIAHAVGSVAELFGAKPSRKAPAKKKPAPKKPRGKKSMRGGASADLFN